METLANERLIGSKILYTDEIEATITNVHVRVSPKNGFTNFRVTYDVVLDDGTEVSEWGGM